MSEKPCSLSIQCSVRKPMSVELLGRREWVKCFALGWAAAVGLGTRSRLLADISAGANVANVIELKVADFPVLQDAYGSVRLALFNTSLPGGIMIVTRAPGDVFHAVNAVCTHAGTIVEPYDNTEFTEAINCYNHGSRYTMDGVVLTPGDSEIAQANLPQYNTAFANGVVRVEIPSLNFKLNAVTVQSVSGNNKRLALNFNPRTSGKYRVKYTPDLVTTPVSVNFATNAGGPANVSLFNATSNSARSLWVDSSLDRGFYFIELVVTQEAALP